MKISTKKIAYIALLTAILVVLKSIGSLKIAADIRVSFSYIPTFLAGFYFGPGAGFLVGVLGDVLGWLMWSDGAWLPLMTLSYGMMGLIPGLVRLIKINEKVRLVISYIAVYLVSSVFLNTFSQWKTSTNGATMSFLQYYLTIRAVPTGLTMLVNMVVNLFLMPVFNRVIAPRAKTVASSAEKDGFDARNGAEYDKEQEIDCAACERGKTRAE